MASKTESKDIPIQQRYLSSFQLRLLELLREKGHMTRDQICEVFGYGKHEVVLTDPNSRIYKGSSYCSSRNSEGSSSCRVIEQYDKRTTIHDNLLVLQNRELVEKFSRSNGKRGRPPVFFKIKEKKL